ncbi:MAG TPA: hypothetical protein VHC43_10935 [Mycobacteriales bacterium]|nr:hypothetical protein [Mycobacteriales bacterium]
MEWIQRRAGLIGIGAVVVAAVAIGVAVANSGSGHGRPVLRVANPYFAQRFAPRPPLGLAPRELRRLGRAQPALPVPYGGHPVLAAPVFPLGAGGALHGELTVPTPDGKYETVDVQRGKVTKVGSGQLTVRSDDGFTKTYSAPAGLIRNVKVGDEVRLRASVANGKSTVTTLMSLNRATR